MWEKFSLTTSPPYASFLCTKSLRPNACSTSRGACTSPASPQELQSRRKRRTAPRGGRRCGVVRIGAQFPAPRPGPPRSPGGQCAAGGGRAGSGPGESIKPNFLTLKGIKLSRCFPARRPPRRPGLSPRRTEPRRGSMRGHGARGRPRSEPPAGGDAARPLPRRRGRHMDVSSRARGCGDRGSAARVRRSRR